MNSFNEQFLTARSKILAAKNIGIITHINPDGDCIGSSLALSELIKTLGKSADVFNERKIPDDFKFITGNDDFINFAEPNGTKYDLVIFVDCGNTDRAGTVSWVYESADFIINIDHHETNTMFGDINIVDPTAAATAILIYQMFKMYEIPLNMHVAELIYMAIITDTGNFSFSNANKQTHLIAGELVEFGVDVASLTQKLFRETTYNRLKLKALALDSLRSYFDGRVAVIKVTKAMFAETGTDSSDSEDVVGMIRDIRGVHIAALLRDTTDGKLVKVSFRSNGAVDVAAIAEEYAGGGHKNAAGCSIEGTVPEVEKILIERLSREFQ